MWACQLTVLLIKQCILDLNMKQNAILYQEAAMTSNPLPRQQVASLFAKHPCWRIEPLSSELEYSVPSIRRYLKQLGYHRSFSHNGTWYTLRHVPTFNRDGLWFSNDIGFSKAGNLINTLIKLTTSSLAGLTAEALGEKLRCRCHSVLVQLYRQGRLQREKAGRSFVYFAGDSRIAETQRQAMQSPGPLPAEIAVLILVEFINNPESSFEQLALALKKKNNVSVKTLQIKRLFEQYGVKKTPKTAARKLYGP